MNTDTSFNGNISEDLSDLFAEADRIGNKYLTQEEIEEYQSRLKETYDDSDKIITLLEHKLGKDDVLGAIDQSILVAEQTKSLARKAIQSLSERQETLEKLVNETLSKYPTL